jgi:hypothetical protein
MKQFLFLLAFSLPLCGASKGYRQYQKALNAYARDRSAENFLSFQSAYTALIDSRATVRGERIAAESEFKRLLGDTRSLADFIEQETMGAQRARVAQRDALESALLAEKSRIAQLAEEQSLARAEIAALKTELEAVEKARRSPEREAHYEQLRTTIRALMDTTDISPKAAPAAVQNRMDRLFDLYSLADRFAQITQNPADKGLRKKILIALRALFLRYQGPQGTQGDATIRTTYRARINPLLEKEELTSLKEPLKQSIPPGEDPLLD